jgi:hypothetical protein
MYNVVAVVGANVNSDWRCEFALWASESRGDVEVAHLMQGMFADAAVAEFVGIYNRGRNVLRHWGDADAVIDWTTWEDTARFIAEASLDERPVPEKLFVAGDQTSILGFRDEFAKLGRPAPDLEALGTLDQRRDEIARRRAAEPEKVTAWLPLMYPLGLFGGQARLGPLENARYPNVRPESLRAAMARGAL